MALQYRRRKDGLDPDWHFSERCERWPKSDYQDIGFIDPTGPERVCRDCARLETEITSD